MLRRTILLPVVCILLSLDPGPALAQGTNPLLLSGTMATTRDGGAAPDSGLYDRRSLRFESHHWGLRIIRGNDDAVVGQTRWFRSFDLASIVAPSEPALLEAREFNKNRTPGMWALTLGIVATAADAIMVRTHGSPNFVTSTLGIGGVILIVSGAEHLDRASEALSRSLWWYNRDLKR